MLIFITVRGISFDAVTQKKKNIYIVVKIVTNIDSKTLYVFT